MKRDVRLYLDDILEAARKIERYTDGITVEQFRNDPLTADAVMRNLSVIGEAAKHVPETVRKKYPGVPWKEMAGMRDKLIHGYFGVSYDVLWETADKRLPEVRKQVEKALKEEDKK